ncbi:MAG: ASCH domain-containing protein [Nanoarchaeota archaeon]
MEEINREKELKMKVLSLKQPYAELILQGKKKIELRNWNTHFRGEFLIHASKISDAEAMRKFNFNTLPLGGIVGKANLLDVKLYKNYLEHGKDKDLHLASSSWGNFGFLLENPIRLNFKPLKGQLNFFDIDLNVLEELK